MARKEKPIYEKIETSGELTELDGRSDYLRNSYGSYSPNINRLTMSVYSDFIPLLYLTSGLRAPIHNISSKDYTNITGKTTGITEWSKKHLRGVFSGYTNGGYTSEKNTNIIQLKAELKRWIGREARMDVESLTGYPRYAWDGCDRNNIIGRMGRFQLGASCQRTYTTATSALSLYLGNNEKWNPHVLAVVLPENYVYLKYKLLTQNVLDLSKVIILMDRELDTTAFPKQPFRKLYREGLMPHIMKSSCDVWKVPQSFIREKCFVEPFSLRGIGPLERKKVLEQLIEGFTKSLVKEKSGDIRTGNWVTTGASNIAVGYNAGYNTITSSAVIEHLQGLMGINPSVEPNREYMTSIDPYRNGEYTVAGDIVTVSGRVELANYDEVMAREVAEQLIADDTEGLQF
jgi:hypothetical protein